MQQEIQTVFVIKQSKSAGMHSEIPTETFIG